MLYDGLIVLALLIAAAAVALPLSGAQVRAGINIPYTAYLLLVWLAYLWWCWTRAGQTLGMRAWKIRIETIGGQLPGTRESLLRFGMAWVSAACLGLGYLSSLWHPDKACWHDRVSGTRLIRYRK
jgi:uncharacterized RDD family membrane protein YckC